MPTEDTTVPYARVRVRYYFYFSQDRGSGCHSNDLETATLAVDLYELSSGGWGLWISFWKRRGFELQAGGNGSRTHSSGWATASLATLPQDDRPETRATMTCHGSMPPGMSSGPAA